MPSPLFADRPADPPPEWGPVDALITRTRRLRGDVAAVRGNTEEDDETLRHWQRALYDLAVHQLDDLSVHLDQLRAGRPGGSAGRRTDLCVVPRTGPPTGRVGSAEWNFLTDEVSWSDELYQMFGRPPGIGPMPLDELPALVLPDDQALLTAMVTDCLIDGRPIDGEFRIVRSDGQIRTLHMRGEPVLDPGGCTASMWAVLRDVSELRRGERAVRESRDALSRRQPAERTEQRLVAELREALLPRGRTSPRSSRSGPATLDLTVRHLPSATGPVIGDDWYDTLELPCGDTLLALGDVTGHGVGATSATAMLLGAVRGMAVAGIGPGALLGHLNQLLDATEQPALGSALCSRYDPTTRTFAWAQAGHPAPLLFRGGTGRALTPPDGVLLGATPGAAYEQADIRLETGDLLVLHTDGLAPDRAGSGRDRLLTLAPLLTGTGTARECATVLLEEFGGAERDTDACVMVARVGG
ncbi:PP2C family protein-serine/threonine phosphatase [Streptomyces sp. NPDC088725]|uniref:PP2C family protein-serine/threonine phosphatase n=1 Tax=Streptomyces sp. NPDC088725 TaxID=3365873 RepID=UPI0038243C40